MNELVQLDLRAGKRRPVGRRQLRKLCADCRGEHGVRDWMPFGVLEDASRAIGIALRSRDFREVGHARYLQRGRGYGDREVERSSEMLARAHQIGTAQCQ